MKRATLTSVLIALGIAVALTAASEPATRRGKNVHIVDDRCLGGCEFTSWTTKIATRLRATPDEASAVVAELPQGERVQGIAARTTTTYLPPCTFVMEEEGERADCVKPECERVKFHVGDEFFFREHRGLMSLIEYRDSEFQIPNRVDFVKQPSGKYEVVGNYRCDGRLQFKTSVQVSLPNGTTGWADRENFDGTVKWDGTLGGKLGGPRPLTGWRVAAVSDDSLFLVDAASVARSGVKVAFRMEQRSSVPLPDGGNSRLHQVDADCASRSWTGRSSFPDRQDGQDVIVTDVVTTVAEPGTVYDAVITAACTSAFKSAAIADPSRYAAAYFAASGSARERLDAAARTQAAEPKRQR